MSDAPLIPAAASPKSAKRKISPAKWKEAEDIWKNGEAATLADLEAQTGISSKELRTRFKERNIRRAQNIDDYNKKVKEELDKKASAAAKLVADRIEETREQHYKMAANIAAMTMAEIIKCKSGGIPYSSARQNLASLESAMKTLKLAREERFAVLGVGDEKEDAEDEIPELMVTELSPEQIEELRNKATRHDEEDEEDDDVVSLEDIADPEPIEATDEEDEEE